MSLELSLSDRTLLMSLVEQGYVSKRKHPYLSLFVYKYTKTWEIDSRNSSKTNKEYISKWSDLMLSVRGLVLTDDYTIISKPFNKFFNIEDVDYHYPTNSSFIVYEKLDGSAIIVSRHEDYLIVNTLGSFESEQAIKARTLLTTMYADYLHLLLENHTYIFEIIYPENQIVINYHQEEKLVLIGITQHTKHFTELSIQDHHWPHKAIIYNQYKTIEELLPLLKKNEFTNEEGFVVWWEKEQVRYKFKYSEYFRLHKIRSNLTPKFIWELISSGKTFNDFINNNFPDEFIQEAESIRLNLFNNYNDKSLFIKTAYDKILNDLSENYSRKDFALLVFSTPEYKAISGILFKMIDNKEYSDMIWKLVEPVLKTMSHGIDC